MSADDASLARAASSQEPPERPPWSSALDRDERERVRGGLGACGVLAGREGIELPAMSSRVSVLRARRVPARRAEELETYAVVGVLDLR